jgi:cysteine sulfinate desulfinase/cysteine desulfurase-like protein
MGRGKQQSESPPLIDTEIVFTSDGREANDLALKGGFARP